MYFTTNIAGQKWQVALDEAHDLSIPVTPSVVKTKDANKHLESGSVSAFGLPAPTQGQHLQKR